MKINFKEIIFIICLCNISIDAFGEDSKGQSLADKPFSCNGLTAEDRISGLEGGSVYFKADTNEEVCSSMMGSKFCPNQPPEKVCICPPKEWTSQHCTEVWIEYSKRAYEKRLKETEQKDIKD